MTTVDKNNKTSAEKAVEAKPPTDGAHSHRARKAMMKEKAENDPAYVVVVKKEDDGSGVKEKSFYKPEEIRAKARALISSGKLTSQEKEVLQEILGPDQKSKPPKV